MESRRAQMHVLQLVTNEEAPFFRQQLSSLEDRGIFSTVLSPKGTHSPAQSRSLRSYLELVRAVRDESLSAYDLVHANYGLTAPAALAQRRLPTVLSLWGSDLNGPLGPVSRMLARRFDEVVVMTPEMAERLGRSCHVVPHGVDFDLFAPADRETARAQVGWTNNGSHVLFPYHPDRTVKDYPTARRVVRAVRRRVGWPVTLQTLPGVPHEEMPGYLNAADTILLTSKHEGSPNVVKEAMACNVPVVARDVGDVALQLAGVDPSRVCRDEAELIAGLESVLRSGVRSNGRRRGDAISAARNGADLEAVYRRALGEGTWFEPSAERIRTGVNH